MSEKFEGGIPPQEQLRVRETQEQIIQLIEQRLGADLIAKAQDIVNKLRQYPEGKGKTATIYTVPHREGMTEEVLYPNLEKFISLVQSLSVTDDMDRIAKKKQNINYFYF